MTNLRTLAPALLGAALLGPAALAQGLPPGHPAIAPYPQGAVSAQQPQVMPMPGYGQPAQGQMPVQDQGPAVMGTSYGGLSASERAENDALRRQEQMAWERERQQLLRQGYGESTAQPSRR